MRNCPYCGEHIEDTVHKCPFCGSDVDINNEREESQATNIKSQSTHIYDDPLNHTIQYSQQPIHNSVSNGMKVFLSMFAAVPIIGQVVGIIMAIIYMNSENDKDRKSFGKALLIGTLSFFFITCLCCIAYFVFAIAMLNSNPEFFEQFQHLRDI